MICACRVIMATSAARPPSVVGFQNCVMAGVSNTRFTAVTCMIGTTLLYPYEVRKEIDVFNSIPDVKIDRDMIDMAHQLMRSKQGHFQPEKFEDRYESALRELVAKKQKGVTLKASAPAKASG